MSGPDKNESQQKFKLFKSRKESMTVHAELEAKRERESTTIDLSELNTEQVQTH